MNPKETKQPPPKPSQKKPDTAPKEKKKPPVHKKTDLDDLDLWEAFGPFIHEEDYD